MREVIPVVNPCGGGLTISIIQPSPGMKTASSAPVSLRFIFHNQLNFHLVVLNKSHLKTLVQPPLSKPAETPNCVISHFDSTTIWHIWWSFTIHRFMTSHNFNSTVPCIIQESQRFSQPWHSQYLDVLPSFWENLNRKMDVSWQQVKGLILSQCLNQLRINHRQSHAMLINLLEKGTKMLKTTLNKKTYEL